MGKSGEAAPKGTDRGKTIGNDRFPEKEVAESEFQSGAGPRERHPPPDPQVPCGGLVTGTFVPFALKKKKK